MEKKGEETLQRAKVIMVQGTMSGAGKSMLTAGLCRVFARDGYRVAPFKSQNMALNSFITEEGLEMGRAQVMQAEAAFAVPSVRMNPILLKPTSDMGSQVIVNGEVIGTMQAKDYFSFKKTLRPIILEAFEALSAEYDIIVIEGAGSPAEINLKTDDIVNMGMAEMACSPVLLVGDIDRGGVFAQLYGTIALLTEKERRMVKGLVINKFRGDRSILESGLDMLKEKCGIPFAGVMPYLDIRLEDEDSLSERFGHRENAAFIDVVVIRFPRISNFTDFNPLENISGVGVRYADRVSELGQPDMICLPGSKNTMGDLRFLRESGLEAAIKKHAARGTVIFGICGGYQMLGTLLRDPAGVEEGGQMRGMGLLPMETVFKEQKTRTRVRGRFGTLKGTLACLSGLEIEGYEIHMGESFIEESAAKSSTKVQKDILMLTQEAGGMSKPDGICVDNVIGTYVHGIFDRHEAGDRLTRMLAGRKGMDLGEAAGTDYASFKETQYDRLAESIRGNMDMKMIYRILDEGL